MLLCCYCCYHVFDVAALLVGHRTYDSQAAGSSPGWVSPRSGLGQATYICVPLTPSSIIWCHQAAMMLIGCEGHRRPGGNWK